MSKSAIRSDGFWADAINSLLLCPPYRESIHPAASTDRFVATASDTSKLESTGPAKEAPNLAGSPSPSFNENDRRSILGLGLAHQSSSEKYPEVQDIYAKNDDASPLGSADTAGEPPLESVVEKELDDGGSVQLELPQQLRDLDIKTLQRAGWGLLREIDHPRYLAEAALDTEYFDAARIAHYGFPGPTASIVAMHIDGDEPEVIARKLNTNEDHVRKWVARAYDQFGVHNREGLLATIQWIVAREAEEFALIVRKKFEQEIIDSLTIDEPEEPEQSERKIGRRVRAKKANR